jgi:hypothetical protein
VGAVVLLAAGSALLLIGAIWSPSVVAAAVVAFAVAGWLGWRFVSRVGRSRGAAACAVVRAPRTVAILGLAALAVAAIAIPLLMATDSETGPEKAGPAVAVLALLTAPVAGWWSRARALAAADAPTARMGTLSLAGGLVLIAETLLILALALEIASHLS